VLVRRAINPPLRTRLEAFGEARLRDALAVSDGDLVVCRID
jgi:CTP-dependent riboflavin kinase